MSSTGEQTQRNTNSVAPRRIQPSDSRGAAKATGKSKMPPRKTWLWFVLVLLANFLLVRLLVPGPKAPVTVPYTLFKEEVTKRNVAAIFSRGETLTGRFKAPITYPPAGEKSAPSDGRPQFPSLRGAARQPEQVSTFATTLPSFVDPGLEAFLIEHGVEISAEPIQESGNPWSTFLFGFGPALLIIGFYVWMFRRAAQQGGGMGGGLMGIGKSKARRYDQEKDTKVTFDDVAGIDEAENELVEIVDFLRDPKKYTRLGGAAPKGVLLDRRARHRQNPAGESGRGRSGRAVLLDERGGVRRDDRRRRRGESARSLQAGARARAGDHLHRRAGCHRPRARADGDRRLERAGADPEPDPDRDGRLLEPRGHHRAGGDEPARRARQGAAAAGTLRSARGGEPAGQDRARGDPQSPHAQRAAREATRT